MIPMALPSDSMFYNETHDQALLFTIAGILGLANWSTLPSLLLSFPLTQVEYLTDTRYLSLVVLLLCIRLDVRGKGVNLPDWLQASTCVTRTIVCVLRCCFGCEINYDN
jgi:hypothetical protein